MLAKHGIQYARGLFPAFAALTIGACADMPTEPTEQAPAFAVSSAAAGVFTSTNAAAGNAVVAYRRDVAGGLSMAHSYPTGGTGTGAGLGSQGAVTLSGNGQWLFVVNAGSDDVSVFAVDGAELTLTDRVSSGGDRPVSVAVHGDLVYVLNAGSDDIAGFRLARGELTSIGAAVPLGGAGTGAAQVSFNPRGDVLVVTERATNRITVFAVAQDGQVSGPTSAPSAGPTPFGFGFHKTGTIVVSEANGGAALGGLVSSYAVSDAGATPITGALATGESAPCWVVVTHDHRYAFVANAGTRSISTLALAPDGSLTIVAAAAANTGSAGPLDMALSRDGRFLYTVTPGSGMVHGFAIGANGSLTALGAVGGLPTSSYGLAGR